MQWTTKLWTGCCHDPLRDVISSCFVLDKWFWKLALAWLVVLHMALYSLWGAIGGYGFGLVWGTERYDDVSPEKAHCRPICCGYLSHWRFGEWSYILFGLVYMVHGLERVCDSVSCVNRADSGGVRKVSRGWWCGSHATVFLRDSEKRLTIFIPTTYWYDW